MSREDEPSKGSVTERTIPGGWSEQIIPFPLGEISIVTPRDPDAFLDDLATKPPEQQEEDVYWAKLWPAALATGRLIQLHAWPKDIACLEIGCGVGLVGVAALKIGLNVTFSDYASIAVETAQENAARNGYRQTRGLVFDWRSPLAERFDLVLASDILYFQKMHVPILNTLDAMLADHGECWFGDGGRYFAGAFANLAVDRGYQVSIHDENGDPLLRPVNGQFQLFKLRRVMRSS